MIKQNQYIELQEVLSRILRHPLLQSVNMEQAVQYTVDFIHIFGLPDMFVDKEVLIPITRFRGQLPCDSFEEGEIKVNYKAIPVDDNGFPLILDNAVYLKALELYIKKEVFTIKFDQGEVSDKVLQHTEQQYAWAAGQLQSEFSIPSEAEMASICHMWTELIQTTTHRDNGYKNLGDRQYLKQH